MDQLIDDNTIIFLCSGIKKQLGDNLNTYIKNMLMISNFLRSKNALKCKKLIYLSSAEVYGENIDNHYACDFSNVGAVQKCVNLVRVHLNGVN